MILSKRYDIIYDIFHIIHDVISYNIFLKISYHFYPLLALLSNFIWYSLWYPNHMIFSMIFADDIVLWYHHYVTSGLMISQLYHGTCAAGWRGLGSPGARPSTSSCLAIRVTKGAGDVSVCSADSELLQPWSRTWTYCSSCCHCIFKFQLSSLRLWVRKF